MDEGYIKFNCNWVKAEPVPAENMKEINKWRSTLYYFRLIGAYPDGIGYGNISIRYDKHSFLITGSATGSLIKLNQNHYALVNEYNLAQNSLTCTGPVMASSESLSHAVIYDCMPQVNAVIHIHSMEMWKRLLHKVPTTDKKIPYGTPEMAEAIKSLFETSDVKTIKIIAMGGHPEGIITFGENLEQAAGILLTNLQDDN